MGNDFDTGMDVISLDGFGYSSFKDARSHMTASDGNVIFSDQGTEITLVDVSLSDLIADNFIFM